MEENKSYNSDIKKTMIEALQQSLGIVTYACEAVKIARQTHYRWMKEDEEYKAAVDDINEITLDYGESKLHKAMEKGDTTAIIFYLKTKGKKRGYIERQEIDNTIKIEGKPTINLEFAEDKEQ